MNVLKDIKATVKVSNPVGKEQKEPKVERDSKGSGHEKQGGADLPEPHQRPDMRGGPRDFRIGKGLIDKFNPTEGCPGCEWWLSREGWRKPHTDKCRGRFEELLNKEEGGKELLKERNARKSSSHLDQTDDQPTKEAASPNASTSTKRQEDLDLIPDDEDFNINPNVVPPSEESEFEDKPKRQRN